MDREKRAWRVGIWAAVSSKQQAGDDKISLQVQRQLGREFAEAIGGQVVRIYAVPGSSRDITFWDDAASEMPAYRQIREDCGDQLFDVLWVYDADRLGRDPALSNQLVSLVEKRTPSDLTESGYAEVYIHTMGHPVGRKGPGHRYGMAFQTTRAGEDQQRRVQQFHWGMAARIRRGLHRGTWPYGYRPVHDAAGKVIGAELDETQAEGVRLITRLFLEGMPYRAIAHYMDGTPYRPRHAKRWPWITINRILQNDTYGGFVCFNDVSARSDKFPPIWDRATHAAVMRERKRRKDARSRRSNSPLLHVAFCARCGSPMHRGTSRTRGNTYRYLVCQAHKAGRKCHKNRVREEIVRGALLAYLRGALTDEAIEEALADRAGATAGLEHRADRVEQQIDDVAEQRKRLALAYAAGQMDIAIYSQADGELHARADALEAARWDLQQQIVTVPDLEQRRQAAQALRARVDTLFERGYEANSLLRDAGIQILIEEGEVIEIRVT